MKSKHIIDLRKLKKDKSEGSYYYSWQANIAMSISDEYYRKKGKKNYLNRSDIHSICNQGAKNFLDLLLQKVK